MQLFWNGDSHERDVSDGIGESGESEGTAGLHKGMLGD